MNHLLKTTEDGSHTFYVPELNEHYHSTHGAIQESKHVFIEAGLKHFSENHPNDDIHILEIGFGTGLNTYLTLLESEKKSLKIYYHSLEFYPIELEQINKLNYEDILSLNINETSLFKQLHTSPWEKEISITPNFTLYKQQIDFSNPSEFKPDKFFNLFYFDAFAPEKQAEMWTQEIFDKIKTLSKKGAIITTYCAKGAVRRMLQSAGFIVERLPGPPGKREILRGTSSF